MNLALVGAMGWDTSIDTLPNPTFDPGGSVITATDDADIDHVLGDLERDTVPGSTPSLPRLETACWDLSDAADATPAPELWHGGVRSRAITFDERRTAIWTPSAELQERASKMLGQPPAVPTPMAFQVPPPLPSSPQPGVPAVVHPVAAMPPAPTSMPTPTPQGFMVHGEAPRAVLPTPQRNPQHSFSPMRLRPGRMIGPSPSPKGSQIPMSARSLQIGPMGGFQAPPKTAMVRLPTGDSRPQGPIARLLGWFGRLFGKRG